MATIPPAEKAKRKNRELILSLQSNFARRREEDKEEARRAVISMLDNKKDAVFEAELERQKAGQGGGKQFALAPPAPENLNIANPQPSGTPLQEFVGQEVPVGPPSETISPGPDSGGGLPPRTNIIESIHTGERQIGGKLGMFLDLLGKGTRTTTSKTSREVENPEFQRVMSDTQQNIGEAIFRVSNRDMRPDAFVKSLQADLQGFTGQEKQLIMRGAQQQARLLGASEVARSRAAANTLMLGTLENFPSLGTPEGARVVHRVATARTPEEVAKAYGEFGGLIFNSAEAKAGRSRQAQEDEIRRMQGEAAKINLDKAKIESAFLTNKMKTDGILRANQIIVSRTPDEVLKSTKGHTRNSKGEIIITDDNRDLFIQDQLESLGLGLPVPLVEPAGLVGGATIKSFFFRDMEKFSHVLQNVAFDSAGRITTDEASIDINKTNELYSEALDYFGSLGIKFDPATGPYVPVDHPDAPILSRALELLSYKEALETNLKRRIPTIYDFSGEVKGAKSLPPMQGPEEPPEPEPLDTPARNLGRSFREFNTEVVRGSRRGNIATLRSRGLAANRGREEVGRAVRGFAEFFEEANRQP